MTAPADAPSVRLDLADGVATVTLARPEAANALRFEDRNAIIAMLAQVETDHDVRVVHLRAEGKVFCAGADMGGLRNTSVDRRTTDAMTLMLRGAQQLIASVLDCGKPVVAEVQGSAAGMGAHLAFACDLVVASERVNFIESFIRRGIVLDAAGAYLLPRRIGLQRAKELAFFGDQLPAAEALALGLVNRVVPPEDLQKTALELVHRLVKAPTSAIALTKRLLNNSLDQDRASAFLAEAMAQEIQGTAGDSREGVQAFVDRREPDFRGF